MSQGGELCGNTGADKGSCCLLLTSALHVSHVAVLTVFQTQPWTMKCVHYSTCTVNHVHVQHVSESGSSRKPCIFFFYCMRWIIEGGLWPNRHNRQRQWLILTQFLDLTSRGSRRSAFRYPADVEDQRLCVISQYQGVLCLPRGAESQIDMLDEHVREYQRVLQLSEIG